MCLFRVWCILSHGLCPKLLSLSRDTNRWIISLGTGPRTKTGVIFGHFCLKITSRNATEHLGRGPDQRRMRRLFLFRQDKCFFYQSLLGSTGQTNVTLPGPGQGGPQTETQLGLSLAPFIMCSMLKPNYDTDNIPTPIQNGRLPVRRRAWLQSFMHLVLVASKFGECTLKLAVGL